MEKRLIYQNFLKLLLLESNRRRYSTALVYTDYHAVITREERGDFGFNSNYFSMFRVSSGFQGH